jgi:SAM-dependent methyltransferase
MKRDFGGQAAAFYHRYRHGYPSAVIDALAGAFKLTGQDVTVDLGCGTGQLSLPIARQVRAVIGMDVEPDMLQHAQQAARDANARNVMWILGVTNGTPLWRQETDWSRALRDFLEHWLGTTLTHACGTDEQSQQRYRDDLAAAGFDVFTTAVDYVASLDLDELVGGVYSAMGNRIPAASQRSAFAERVRAAVAPQDRFCERVHVAILAGTR